MRRRKVQEDERPTSVPAEVVERCRRGDESAWTELVDASYREVYTLCLRVLGNPEDAAEATQDAFVKAWRGLKGFRGDAAFTTWLYRIAMNAAVSKLRSRKRRARDTSLDEAGFDHTPSKDSTEESVAARLEVGRVERALATLPEQYRATIVLRDVYGLSYEEIAAEVGAPLGTVKSRIHDAREVVRPLLRPKD